MPVAALKDTNDTLLDELRRTLGAEGLLSDPQSCAYYANDIFWQPGIEPFAIALPATREEAANAVRAATSRGVAVVPRGGGMSYTKGYLPAKANSLVVDTRRMNAIVELASEDGYVTVEAGCTWAKLNEALEATGIRPGYWQGYCI